ncbi:uncharacterized protein LOC126893912 [Daktulosphaira vitifoliae]|uniref:uncharacterized protein LOC126893912 n=1 Tax=Daktulosphaira vitifoliae TaxID=58002 RepID=UPI0021AAA95A|nr:uncharacterized protein LOC126893912 [Daktulosphaira vitifoliae]
MDFFLLICMTIGVFVLIPDKAEQCAYYREDYKNYVKSVFGYIYSQIELNQMQNQNLHQDPNKSFIVLEAFQPYAYMNDFRENYSYTINLLNFKYTGILKKFLNYLDIILQQCKQFRDENLWENFICCITSLIEELKNSKTLFENLYNAMKFISYIDVRYVFNGNNVPNAIVDEIDFFKQFVLQYTSETVSFDLNSLPNLKDSETKFKNLNEFYTEASEIVNNMFQKSVIIDTSVNTNSTTNPINESSNENDLYLVYLTCSNLNAFYNETIEIWYKNLGFEEFLNPKIPKFTPPIHRKINQNDGIKALNILRQETGWKKMNHINIIYNDKQFSVDCIIKNEINCIDFRIKKEYVTQLLRCRYTEIMKNYCVLLSTILFICNADDNDDYHNCIIELFNSFNKSILLLKGLYTALITLNKSSIWSVNYNSNSNLKNILKWVSGFLRLLKNNEFSLVNNADKPDIQKTEFQKLLTLFSGFRTKLYYEIHDDLKYMYTRCIMKAPFYDRAIIINDFRDLTIKYNNTYP